MIGYLLIYVFAVRLNWLPVQGYASLGDRGLADWLRHLVLPTLALGHGLHRADLAHHRASMLDILGEDFVRTARAKGAPEGTVLFRHALRNAAVPIVTIVGVGITALISGVVVTETVFNIAGVGRMIVDAVLARDYPVVQGTILFFSFSYIFVNLMVDMPTCCSTRGSATEASVAALVRPLAPPPVPSCATARCCSRSACSAS